jgi:hypothetical protein
MVVVHVCRAVFGLADGVVEPFVDGEAGAPRCGVDRFTRFLVNSP